MSRTHECLWLSRLMHYHPLGVHYFTSAHSEPVNYAFDSLTYLYSSSVAHFFGICNAHLLDTLFSHSKMNSHKIRVAKIRARINASI